MRSVLVVLLSVCLAIGFVPFVVAGGQGAAKFDLIETDNDVIGFVNLNTTAKGLARVNIVVATGMDGTYDVFAGEAPNAADTGFDIEVIDGEGHLNVKLDVSGYAVVDGMVTLKVKLQENAGATTYAHIGEVSIPVKENNAVPKKKVPPKKKPPKKKPPKKK